MLKTMKHKSHRRRQLIARSLGIGSVDQLSLALGHERLLSSTSKDSLSVRSTRPDDRKRNTSSHHEEDRIVAENGNLRYTDSSTFLKGTQSANPHNDYCQHFVDTGQRPQNFIRDVGLSDRFEEYPKLKELIRLKDKLISETATPPMYLKLDLRSCSSLKNELRGKFDVILIEPPLAEYQRSSVLPSCASSSSAYDFWSWSEIMSLPVDEIAAQRSFVFLWVGSSDGLDYGRSCLKHWGFRRCEDICWIKRNAKNPGNRSQDSLDAGGMFQRTKEHCLMGIKGTVRRSTDGDFIHANVDIDLMITEEPGIGDRSKPDEIFNIMEHFCLGRRRVHLFGRDDSIRPGWLTVGPELTNSNFNPDAYWKHFEGPDGHLTGCTERIECLRPKSPPASKTKAGDRSSAASRSARS